MEADWEFEIGEGAPVIDALWPGFVDLRWTSRKDRDLRALLETLPEAAQFPGLAAALERLNSDQSPVWTSKCDFWPNLEDRDFDGDELDAPGNSCCHGVGGYIDLLPGNDSQWLSPQAAEASCKSLCEAMHAIRLRCCRVDLMVRRAVAVPHLSDLGITVYFTACGPASAEAMNVLEASLHAFVNVLCRDSTLQ